jgi:hypothetical protein
MYPVVNEVSTPDRKRTSSVSHHFDSPTGGEDPRLNLCDLFVFAGSDETTVLVMTVNPDAGLSSPTELRDEWLDEFKIDTDGDAREDVSFRLVVTDEGMDASAQRSVARRGVFAKRDGRTLPRVRRHG